MAHRLTTELAALRVAELRLARDPDSRALRLEVQLRRRARQSAQEQRPVEPLPALLAGLLRGELSLDTAGQAIARDPALAAQVASAAVSVGGDGAQMGDVRMGDVAGGNLIKIYIGARDEP